MEAHSNKHPRLGLVLKGRYRIEALIASGGMSDVYKAVDQHLQHAGVSDCRVAVKILRSQLTADANALSLLARETAKCQRLSHPNIIRVHDLDQDGDTWFMVMELLDGEPLSRVIQRAKPHGLKWSGGRALLQQVAAALAFSHSRGIVHADLKPSNIFFSRDGEIKLLDFGVAQALRPAQHLDFLNPQSEDETTIYGYTPAYASPALIAGQEPSVRDDLYALACISYELLSSHHPFERKSLTPAERACYRLRKPKNLPRGLWRVIHDLLKNDQPSQGLAAFQAAMAPFPWSNYLYPVSLTAGLTLALVIWQQGQQQSLQAAAQIQDYVSHEQQLQRLHQLPPAQLLTALDDISALSELEKAGFLKLYQAPLLEHFAGQAEQVLQAPGRPHLPNLPAALALVGQAQALYPQTVPLIQKKDQISQRSLSLQAGLAEELQGRLAQGDYRDFEAYQGLTELAADLQFLGDWLPAPEAAARTVFAQQLQVALAGDDGAALARLLKIGDLFFADQADLQQNLARARQQESAIATLGRYHQALAEGQTPGYPRAAAAQFYGDRLAQWQEAITEARGRGDLDQVYNALRDRQDGIPADFAPFAELRQTLADAYLKQADRLLARGQTRQAQALLKRATGLMRMAVKS